jgi:hypothetical protein
MLIEILHNIATTATLIFVVSSMFGNRGGPGDVGGLGRLNDDPVELPRADRLHWVLAGE